MVAILGYVAAVWLVAVVGGYLPYAVAALSRDKSGTGTGTAWISVLNVLSGGVFVAAGFMHLLPQAEDDLRGLSNEWTFQFAVFFTSLGFIVMFVLEELVQQASSVKTPVSSTSQSFLDGCDNGIARWPAGGRCAAVEGGTRCASGSAEYDARDSCGSYATASETGFGETAGSGGTIVGLRGNIAGVTGNSGGLRGNTAGVRGDLTVPLSASPSLLPPFEATDEALGVRRTELNLREDGGRRSSSFPFPPGLVPGNGSRRAGSLKGTYGTVGRSPRSSIRGSMSPTGRALLSEEACRLLAVQSAPSPVKDGHGPWIGRRLSAGEASALEAQEMASVPQSWAATLVDKYRVCHEPNHDGSVSHVDKHPNTAVVGYSVNMGLILGVVLSVHSVIEGLGLGASSPSGAPGIFLAIVLHKGLAAFSLGCVLFSSDASRSLYFVCMGIFSVLTPLGAAVGMVVRASMEGSGGTGVCLAFGAGTFIHVAAMEVLC